MSSENGGDEPASFEVSDVEPGDATTTIVEGIEVTIGQRIEVVATVANTGDGAETGSPLSGRQTMRLAVVTSGMVDRRAYEFEETSPTVDDDAHVSRESTLVGDVRIEADASVWPGVVLRGDVAPVRIGRESHVGDNATIHAGTVGDRVMIGHGAVLNEATVENGSLVGFNATVNSGVTIGEGSIVASGTVLPEEYAVPANAFARGIPARVTPLEETEIDPSAVFDAYSSGDYTDLAERHDELFE